MTNEYLLFWPQDTVSQERGTQEGKSLNRDTELLTEIRDFLQVLAEPALAKRDAKFRSLLRTIVGRSVNKSTAIQLMDGSRAQADIVKEAGIDHGNLSRLVNALAEAQLISADKKCPKLVVKLPSTFFDEREPDE